MSDPNPYRSESSAVSGWLVVVLVALATALVFRVFSENTFSINSGVPRAITPRGDLAQNEKTTIELFRSASPCVVYITTVELRHDVLLRTYEAPSGTGSGIIWDDRGHVVTNFHVVADAIESGGGASVTLADNTTWAASLVGYAPQFDLAVLRITAPKGRLSPIAIGTSSDLEIGQNVFAIGGPFGLNQTLTTGVIGGLNRAVQAPTGDHILGAIQTDAAINPGNSGGPLLDSAGRLIGVNTAILSPSGAYAGIGFAVPVDTVNRIVPDLIEYGRVVRPGLGVTLFSDSRLRALIKGGHVEREGALIEHVLPNSNAEKAGLRPTQVTPRGQVEWGDLIIGFNRLPITSSDDLHDRLGEAKIDDTVTISILRGDVETSVDVKLQALPTFRP